MPRWLLLRDDQLAKVAQRAPCCFVRDACLPLNLLRGNTGPGGYHQIRYVEPGLERSRAPFKHGPFERVNVIPTLIAGVGSAASDAIMLALGLALFALGDAIRPTLHFYVFEAGIIILEVAVKIG